MTRPKKRYNRDAWMQAALEVLSEKGGASVRIDALAGKLHVTKGSFYHHFRDRADLLDSLLQHWSTQLTMKIREQVAALQLDPSTTLLVLLRTIRAERAAEYDAPFPAWALHDERARAVVQQVDEERLKFIRCYETTKVFHHRFGCLCCIFLGHHSIFTTIAEFRARKSSSAVLWTDFDGVIGRILGK